MAKPASDKPKRAAAAKSTAKPRARRRLQDPAVMPDGTPYVPIKDWVPAPRPITANEAKFADPGKRQATWTTVMEALERGLSLNKACALIVGGLEPATVLRWAADNEALSQQYAAARRIGYNALAEDIKDISDTPQVGHKVVEVVNPDGTITRTTTYEEMLGHRRLQTDTRKWLLSKCLPKIYGDVKNEESANNAALVDQLRELAARLPV